MTIQEIYKECIETFRINGIEHPEQEARLLILHSMNITQNNFYLNKGSVEISKKQYLKFKKLVKKRLSGVNIFLLINKKHFYDVELFVDKNVLVPRPETEMIIDIVCQKFDKKASFNILDIGTGSGNLALTLAKHFKNSIIDALDIKRKSLVLVKKNVKINNIDINKINLIKCNILKNYPDKNYDIIVSNPPYINSCETKKLLKNKIISDPRISLDGGVDGLNFYRKFKEICIKCLNIDGWFIMEHGIGQRMDILNIFNEKYFNTEYYDDYSGIDRIIAVQKKDY